MILAILCHRDIHHAPRGAENSVRMIADYLGQYMDLIVTAERSVFHEAVEKADCVLTWGTAVPHAAKLCISRGVPYIVMVRWWRLIQPTPPGDLLTREIDTAFVERNRYIFENAYAVVTNNHWATKVIDRYYGVRAKVAYVPRPEGGIKGSGNPDGHILLVSPIKQLGAERLVRELAPMLPDERFVVVNAPYDYEIANVKCMGYYPNMDLMYRGAKVLLYPIYGNDVCGTSRVFIEAAQYGVPTIANGRSGFCEKGALAVSRDAPAREWADRIREVSGSYDTETKRAQDCYHAYGDQMRLYRGLVERAARRVAA